MDGVIKPFEWFRMVLEKNFEGRKLPLNRIILKGNHGYFTGPQPRIHFSYIQFEKLQDEIEYLLDYFGLD